MNARTPDRFCRRVLGVTLLWPSSFATIAARIIPRAAFRVHDKTVPEMMTVFAAFIGLLPVMWSTGTGADLIRRDRGGHGVGAAIGLERARPSLSEENGGAASGMANAPRTIATVSPVGGSVPNHIRHEESNP